MANQLIKPEDLTEENENEEELNNDAQSLVKNNPIKIIKSTVKKQLQISLISLASLIFIFIIVVAVFSIINNRDITMKKGVKIENIDVSGLTKEQAKQKIKEEVLDKLDTNIFFQYGDSIYSLALEQLEVEYKLDEAIDKAYSIGRTGSIIQRDIKVLSLKKHPENIIVDYDYDEITLDACIVDISAKLPEQVEQPSYYIENGELIITSGKVGKAARPAETKAIVEETLLNKDFNDRYFDIPTRDKYPDEIDVEKIHSEIYREVRDAYFTTEPRMVYAEETGIDFENSIEEVKEQIETAKENGQKTDYVVALHYTPANVTVDDLGMDAFPDELSSFATYYIGSSSRLTNLQLASSKINGTVIMPGETFSYNSTVGERSIAAGFREATVFENGQAVSGLGGGICQVSTTLYNAVLYSNLEVVERTNHMFLSVYFTGGRDATVAWGSLDFKFKNNREYPIKISSYVGDGGVHVSIYGLRTENDYNVEIHTNYLGSGTYQTYKKLIDKNGQVVSDQLISTDYYRGSH